MARIRSNHDAPLHFPGGQVLRAGGSMLVTRWNTMKRNSVVAAWLAAGAISVQETEAEIAETEAAEKRRLLAALDQAEVEASPRWGLKRLRATAASVGIG